MHPWVIYPVLSYLAHFSAATLVNRTIDDQFGDSVTRLMPNYSTITGWSQGADCTGCHISLNPGYTFNGTWHDTTYIPAVNPSPASVNITFNGTAVYAYCVLANAVQEAATYTNLTFLMDGELVGTFEHIPTTSTAYQYNTSVYANTSLSYQEHILTIMATGTNMSVILFDYPDPSPTLTSKSPNVGAIVGGVIGGIMMIVIAVLAFFLIRRRRRNATRVAIDVYNDKTAPNHGLIGTNLQHTALDPHGEVHGETVTAHSMMGVMNRTSADTQLGSAAAPSFSYGGTHSGMVVRSPPAPGSKAAQRQEEIARQVQAREEELASLQKRRGPVHGPTSSAPASSAPASSVSPTSSGSGAETDAAMALEVERLKQEVDRLQTQQREMLWEMNDAPPPVYE
ncbi:hypothetical protein FIBSPDRAFT_877525 [Athelia psychrophila]|uniref:Uncharacterized protein n=1 Tax=Athelia psychrophila TaxID=1759441 RepID=A0A167VX12_9AGAM|nr:hypothetical protein FIBSPDRAFT_877525 [Fibularhizoctonia sp. CBS 109695]